MDLIRNLLVRKTEYLEFVKMLTVFETVNSNCHLVTHVEFIRICTLPYPTFWLNLPFPKFYFGPLSHFL